MVAALFAISVSIDALGIGVSYGVRKIKMSFQARFIISVISALITGASMFLGGELEVLLPKGAANWIGVLLLLAMGVWVIIQGLGDTSKKEARGNSDIPPEMRTEHTVCRLLIKSLGISIAVIRHPQQGDLDHSNSIEPLEALYIGLALSMDSLGAGIAMGVMGFKGLFIPLWVACGQFIFLSAGLSVGKKVPAGRAWVFVSGALLIIMAVLRTL